MKIFITVSFTALLATTSATTVSNTKEITSLTNVSEDKVIIRRPCLPWRKCDKHTGDN